jgi:hypothetical protein
MKREHPQCNTDRTEPYTMDHLIIWAVLLLIVMSLTLVLFG